MVSGTRIAAIGAVAGALFAAAAVEAKEFPLEPPRIDPESPMSVQLAWANRYLDQDGWMLPGRGNGSFWLVSSEQTVHNEYPIVRDWVRIESAAPPLPNQAEPSNSHLWRLEVDCSKRTWRRLRSIFYRYNNLRGRILADGEESTSWTTAKDETVMWHVLDAVCRGAEDSAPGA